MAIEIKVEKGEIQENVIVGRVIEVRVRGLGTRLGYFAGLLGDKFYISRSISLHGSREAIEHYSISDVESLWMYS